MIPVQAAIGAKLLQEKQLKVLKDVLTKIHGGGAVDRKRKVLEKQKKGKQELNNLEKLGLSRGIHRCVKNI